MYVLKVDAYYVMDGFTRFGLSDEQREARRFSDQDRVRVSDDALQVLFGPDARFVRLLEPGTFARRRLTDIASSPDPRD